ncbi:hypothetical protein B447_06757 [Thauera sp. 27]|uniref:TSUP family transporter n=1 Tax=Thauera sp. 27 TaxID=305700 RepID=UPI0002CD8EDF|nr:TSUP family transporter [Thauera sp. 27]ENO81844.1 hypothetical protein B447_06757 [Thauera sp. 27]
MTFEIFVVLGLVAFLAGLFDAIAGGGGLITLPALFVAGLDPVSALATNKLQATAATVSATAAYSRKGLIDWRLGRWVTVIPMIGGAAGALMVNAIEKRWVEAGIPFLLIAVAIYFAVAPSGERLKRVAYLSIPVFAITISPLLGFYDGFFGPGIGSFFMIGLMALCGLNTMQAVGLTKVGNASCNVGSLMVFVAGGAVIWPLAAIMAAGAFVGAQLGARCAVFVGPRLVKPMIVMVCCGMAFKLLNAQFSSLYAAIRGLM